MGQNTSGFICCIIVSRTKFKKTFTASKINVQTWYVLAYLERSKIFNINTKLPRRHDNFYIHIARVYYMVWKNYHSLCNTFTNLSKIVHIMYPLISRYLHDKLIFNFTAKEQKYQHNFCIFLTKIYKMRLF